MSRDGSIELLWAGDLRRFRLGIGEMLALQEKLDAGPQQIANRFATQQWRVQDAQETIRLGLIGAGEDPKKALDLVDRFAAPGKLKTAALVAHAVIIFAILGDENDPVGKQEAEADETKATIAFPPPPSMEQG